MLSLVPLFSPSLVSHVLLFALGAYMYLVMVRIGAALARFLDTWALRPVSVEHEAISDDPEVGCASADVPPQKA